ncbi:MAG: NifB/NifX family molybdenum-iron cluster-binding protein [Desulfobacteraceae bacterium]|nr:NifB/NifX family molybdenum-iron cluster-binding protein [Desulfobacteraceae bacterium]
MKICFPVETDTINNQDLGHVHGMCNPLKALNGKPVDVIVVGGIGAGAINKLNAMGVKVYRACEGTVQNNIDLFQNSIMPEMPIENACGGHAGGCGH